MAQVNIVGNKVDRRYTPEWRESGYVDVDAVPNYVIAVVTQHEAMCNYIEALHDKIDELLRERELQK